MHETDHILFGRLSAKKADLIVLILASQGIGSNVVKEGRTFSIRVRHRDVKQSLAVMDLYFKENRFFGTRPLPAPLDASSFKSATALFIISLLWIIHWGALFYDSHRELILRYGSSALFIYQGETYRAITALFLHSDIRHLLGNTAGLLLFAAPVITLTGYGAGPFMLLFAGTGGNLINAWLRETAQLSIGASTSVMGAAGLLAAFQAVRGDKSTVLNRIMPLLAAAVLVALFSGGENTDITAHIFGLACGFAPGLFLLPLNHMIKSPLKDPVALLICLFISVSAFLSGR